jgi:CDP-diacylglycerol--glycerol-3-phosphate 3-phosphatidyltransferase
VKITANMVTMTRIVLLPGPCALLLVNADWAMWSALVTFTILGATDFIDGMMARKEGPTRVGGLLDPVADKMMVAAIALPLCARTPSMAPWWVVAALITRELVVTALRSGVALRDGRIKTSFFAKLKTIFQMGGFGTVFICLFVPVRYSLIFFAVSTFLLIAVVAYYRLAKGRSAPFWIAPSAGATTAILVALHLSGPELAVLLQYSAMVFITIGSGLDYLIGAWKLLAKTGPQIGDFARGIWAGIHGLLVAPLVFLFPAAVLPVLVSVAAELATGGVDNVVVADKKEGKLLPFWISALAGAFFGAAAWGTHLGVVNLPVFWMALPLAAISLGVFVWTFYDARELFRHTLDAPLEES